MYRRFHDRFGTAGVVIGVIALIVALGGSAFAASGGLNAKQKKEVKKIAKGFQGTGPAGAAGTNGKDGTNGTDGTKGTDGVSAEGVAFGPTEEPASEPCGGLGGVEVKSASPGPSYVCNGAEGSPWTAAGTLPEGKTETGAWGVFSTEFIVLEPISFPIPLAAGIASANTHIVSLTEQETEEVPPECTVGGVEGTAANPKASQGHLCVFVARDEEHGTPEAVLELPAEEVGASRSGALLSFSKGAGSSIGGTGAFAVTAPVIAP